MPRVKTQSDQSGGWNQWTLSQLPYNLSASTSSFAWWLCAKRWEGQSPLTESHAESIKLIKSQLKRCCCQLALALAPGTWPEGFFNHLKAQFLCSNYKHFWDWGWREATSQRRRAEFRWKHTRKSRFGENIDKRERLKQMENYCSQIWRDTYRYVQEWMHLNKITVK